MQTITNTPQAIDLANVVLSMGMVTDKGLTARRLAREILGITEQGPAQDLGFITTNGTTRLVPSTEPVFLIRGQDVHGAATVRYWADRARASGAGAEIVASAQKQAELMDAWPHKKAADLPV